LILLLAAIAIDGRNLIARRQAAVQPPVLGIVGAAIEYLPPYRADIAQRRVRFRIQTAAPPRCGGGAGRSEYGFLIDADRSRATGVTDADFDELGIDARIVMRCDEPSGRFRSPLGPVTLQSTGGAALELVTTVGQLPSVDFLWVPYGATADQLVLFPTEPRHGRWAILERVMP
jgi:hypothetical protein